MEEHKKRTLSHFLKRTKKPFQIIFDNLTKVVQDLKDSYDFLGDVWQSDTERFLMLMVLDGCFMLEVVWGDPDNYAPNDPIFSAHGNLHVMPYIRRDMLLLENQLPMRVLIELASGICTEKQHARMFVNRLVYWFTKSIRPDTGECLHVLDIFRKSMLLSHRQKRIFRRSMLLHALCEHDDDSPIIVSAMELQEAGIRFKRIESRCPDVISFKDRVLRLPFLVVDDTTESVFLNLIAFERLHVGTGNEVTSYIFFMDTIIKSVRDVSLLKSNGIIQNASGSEEAIVQLFKSLSKGTKLEPGSDLDVVHELIRMYRMKPWNQFRANFAHAYYKSSQWSPWGSWSIIFGIFLSLVQLYTLFSLNTVQISK
ncbi:UPF0481 protein At3g47200-like [Actinidia eriantha]|uniref:UPF0481 protein At3g47200-like n=1 Tax=Actinidia eriantha TaxID=165200 RepID=UPI00258EE0C6|nr:UPF0481 protein At3g47200-like [Actinidia eriantha]